MPSDCTKIGAFYDDLSPDGYDEMFRVAVKYTDPKIITENFFELKLSKDVKVLDVGAGTGIIGELLHEGGITNIDALDASTTFLDTLVTRGYYKTAKIAMLGYGNFPEPERKELYDVVTACGVFLKGHMPKEALDEIHQYLKPNGYFVTAMRQCYYDPFEPMGYFGKFQSLLDSGKFKLVKKNTFVRGLTPEQNVTNNDLWALQDCFGFVFQKI